MVRPDYLRQLVRIVPLGVVELDDASARGTDAARFMVLRHATVQRSRHFECEAFLAYAFFADEQQRTGQSVGYKYSFQRRFDALVSRQFTKHNSSRDGRGFAETE